MDLLAFKSEFNSRSEKIRARIDTESPEVILKSIDDLMSWCRAQRLTAYDMERVESVLAGIVSQVRSKPRRFQFKSKVHPPSLAENQTCESLPMELSSLPAQEAVVGEITRPCNNARRCVIYEPSEVGNVHLKNIADSIILLPQVTGSAYLSNITNSVVVVGCQQCRIHESSNVTIYLGGCENPIIESCSGILIGNVDVGMKKYIEVSDFSWLRQDPSPNWKQIAELHISHVVGSEARHAQWLLALQTNSPAEVFRHNI